MARAVSWRRQGRMTRRITVAAGLDRSLERQRLEEIRDAPGPTDHRIGREARARRRDGPFRQPFQVGCCEQCAGSSSMSLEVAFQLKTQHPQGRMPGQHGIELTHCNLDRPWRQVREGLGRRAQAGMLDQCQVPQPGAHRRGDVQHLREGFDRYGHGASDRAERRRRCGLRLGPRRTCLGWLTVHWLACHGLVPAVGPLHENLQQAPPRRPSGAG